MNETQKDHLKVTIDNIMKVASEEVSILKNSKDLTITEVGDGNVNYIFRIKDEEANVSVIAKYADEFIRDSETRKLSTKRSEIEYLILDVQNKLAPNTVPEVYYFDKQSKCIYMEDLVNHQTMRDALKERQTFPHFSRKIANFLYRTLFKTTDIVMDSKEKKERVANLVNVDMCEISERLVFTEPYNNFQGKNSYHPDNEKLVQETLYNNEALLKEVAILKNNFKNNAQSMIHGDLHSGSIFINKESIKVFDPEFSFYGPMGYDIGNIIGNLTINYIIAKKTSEDNAFINWLEVSVPTIIDAFIEVYNENYDHDVTDPMMQNESFKETYLQSIINDTFGYAGTELIRRTVGAFKVMELDEVKGTAYQRELESELIQIGENLILNRNQFKNGTDFLNTILFKKGIYN